MRQLTTPIRNALHAAASSAGAGERPEREGEMDLTPRQWDTLEAAIEWLDSIPRDAVVVALSTAQIRALIKWANLGIKDTEGTTVSASDHRSMQTAIKAMQALVEQAGGTHEMYGGMVRHDL